MQRSNLLTLIFIILLFSTFKVSAAHFTFPTEKKVILVKSVFKKLQKHTIDYLKTIPLIVEAYDFNEPVNQFVFARLKKYDPLSFDKLTPHFALNVKNLDNAIFYLKKSPPLNQKTFSEAVAKEIALEIARAEYYMREFYCVDYHNRYLYLHNYIRKENLPHYEKSLKNKRTKCLSLFPEVVSRSYLREYFDKHTLIYERAKELLHNAGFKVEIE